MRASPANWGFGDVDGAPSEASNFRPQSPRQIRSIATQPTPDMFTVRFPLPVSLLLLAASPAFATTLLLPNVAVIQNFDTLANSGTTNSVIPVGWSFAESGTGANTTYAAGTGSSATGNTYSFGATGSTDRAWGTLRTSSLTSIVGTEVTNSTGGELSSLLISFVGEHWRLGAVSREDRLDFAYSLDATSLVTGTWVDVNDLDFVAPVNSGTTGALNGNDSVNQSLISSSLTGLNLSSGATIWVRWSDFAASGSNDGLGIDDVSITGLQAAGSGSPPTSSVPDTTPMSAVAVMMLGLIGVNAVFRRRNARR